MIKILFLHAGAEMYGADKVMLDLIRSLDKKQFSAHVILPCDGVLAEALKRENISVEIIPYPIMRRKYFNPMGVIRYGTDLLRYSKQITRIAAKRKVDIVHSNTAATLEGCFVSKKLNIPQLWSIHEIIVKPMLMFKLTSRWISKYADVVVTVSGAAKQHLMSSGYFEDNDIHVIYNGVDTNRFNPGKDETFLRKECNIPDNAQVIGMIGRVNSWKGQGDLLKASNVIMSKNPYVYTIFAGAAFEGEEWRENELQDAIGDSPYKDRIINLGYRSDSERIYKLLDVFVLPSTNPDPLPTVVLEAMATGKPIVGYRHGGICEMVSDGENGLLAEVRNPEDLARKISVLLDDDELRLKMGQASRKRLLEKFSIEAYVDNYSREYLRLADPANT